MANCSIKSTMGWDTFTPYIAPYVKGAPDVIMAHAARLAAIEFARSVNILSRVVYIDTQAGVADYPLEIDDGYTAVAVRSVCLSGRELPLADSMLCRARCQSGFTFSPELGLYINPAPSDDGKDCLVVTVTVVPGQDSCYVDPVLYNEFAEIIGDGAVSRLLLMNQASWYAPQLSREFLAKFVAAVKQAKIIQLKGRSSAPQFMKPMRFI